MEKNYSLEGHDLFAFYLNKKAPGYFLDIGCNPHRSPTRCNNTLFLEENGWFGLFFDLELGCDRNSRRHVSMRVNKGIKIDCTTQDFEDILTRYVPKKVNYISLDIDEASTGCLQRVMNSGIKFKTMTLEHNAGLDDDGKKARDAQRKLLEPQGYVPLFKDVSCRVSPMWAWEDWWINPSDFDESIMDISGENILWSECIERIKSYERI
jgi:hypothetical protein